MNAIAQDLAKPLRVETNRRVVRLDRAGQVWRLHAEANADQVPITWEAETVLITTPAPQAIPLLGESPEIRSAAEKAAMAPTWAVLVSFHEPLDLPFGGAFVANSPLSWIARNSCKPGRPPEE